MPLEAFTYKECVDCQSCNLTNIMPIYAPIAYHTFVSVVVLNVQAYYNKPIYLIYN